MGLWILLGIALLLILLRVREHYVEIEGPGERPTRNAEWLSKIDAQAPIGGNDDDYLVVLQKFYDEVYSLHAQPIQLCLLRTLKSKPL